MGNDTPTNDAPVTVEGYAEAEAMLSDIIRADLISDTAIRIARDHMMQFARHRLAALASAPAGVNIKVRQKTQVVADYGDNFLVAQVSADGKTVGIDHPCDAVWSDVDRAQTALRDYINERIAGQDKCPFKPRDPASAPAGDGVERELRDALGVARRAIVQSAKDTLWCDDSPAETVVDRIDAALDRPRAAVLLRQLVDENALSDPIEGMPFAERGAVIATLRRMVSEKTAAGDMAAFSASDAACTLYPGADQQAERAAFCEGAAHALARPRAAVGEREA